MEEKLTRYLTDYLCDVVMTVITTQVDPSSQCSQVLPVGCIFEELLNGTNPSVVVGGEKEPDAQVCHTVCSALSAHTTKHVGVRWNEANSQMICYCLKPDAWNSSLVGPWAACDRSCQPFGNVTFDP